MPAEKLPSLATPPAPLIGVGPAADRVKSVATAGPPGLAPLSTTVTRVSDGAWSWVDGPATITQLLCDTDGQQESAVMATEEAYVRALRSVIAYQLAGDELTLIGPDVELRYTRMAGASS